jgi:very-short-patch-repair endonuclease
LRQNMTAAEKILWQELRSKKLWVKFLRQHPIYVFTEDSWQYRFIIADFYCDEYKLIIELDWGIHDILEIEELDRCKEDLLNTLWYNIIRFRNDEILNDLNWVLKRIHEIIV